MSRPCRFPSPMCAPGCADPVYGGIISGVRPGVDLPPRRVTKVIPTLPRQRQGHTSGQPSAMPWTCSGSAPAVSISSADLCAWLCRPGADPVHAGVMPAATGLKSVGQSGPARERFHYNNLASTPSAEATERRLSGPDWPASFAIFFNKFNEPQVCVLYATLLQVALHQSLAIGPLRPGTIAPGLEHRPRAGKRGKFQDNLLKVVCQVDYFINIVRALRATWSSRASRQPL